jgi:hypothetical protein
MNIEFIMRVAQIAHGYDKAEQGVRHHHGFRPLPCRLSWRRS